MFFKHVFSSIVLFLNSIFLTAIISELSFIFLYNIFSRSLLTIPFKILNIFFGV